MQNEEFDIFCQKCKILVAARVIAKGFGEYLRKPANLLDDENSEYHVDRYSVAICRRCNGPFLVREALYGVTGEFESVTKESILYPIPPEAKFEDLPDSIAHSMAQAHRSYSTSSYDACALMCRRALEALCRALQTNGSSLASRLAELKERGCIDVRLIEWAHGVRLVGNEAAHDVEAAVSAEDARDILEFTEALLMYVYTLDTKFRSFTERRKARVGGTSGHAAK